MAMLPIDSPDLLPLRNSAEYDQLESELKAIFLAVFNGMIRARERSLNLYGMPHLGDSELLERNLKADGLAVIRRDASSLSFLLKSWRSRNPKRGLGFLQTYLQTVFPNDWTVDQLWHPIATADAYPAHRKAPADPQTHFLTSRVRVGIDVSVVTSSDLTMMARALRSTLAARLVLEIILSQRVRTEFRIANGFGGRILLRTTGTLINQSINPQFSTIGGGASAMMAYQATGALINQAINPQLSTVNSGAAAIMTYRATGGLLNSEPNPQPVTVNNGAVGIMNISIGGTLET